MNILLVDDQDDILDLVSIGVYDFLTVTNLFMARNSIEAIDIIKNNKIDLCICDHNMPNGNGNFVLQYIQEFKLPIQFVLCSSVTPEEMPHFYPRKDLLMNIQKPEIFAGIERLAQLLNDQTSAVYIPISIKSLLLLEVTPSDVYIKLSDEKFVKCLNKNINFLKEDYSKYQNKEVSQLYIKADELDFSQSGPIQVMVQKICESNSLSLSEKISTTHDMIFNLIKNQALNTATKDVVMETVNQSMGLLQSSTVLEKHILNLNLMGEYPSQLYTLNSIIAHTIARKCNWSTKQTLLKLNLSCFLQNIHHSSVAIMKLKDYNDFLQQEKSLSSEEKLSFLTAPEKTKNFIDNFNMLPHELSKIIYEQYESPTGSGFPRKLTSLQINTISAVFILSSILSKYILNNHRPDFNQLIQYLTDNGYNKGNFKEPFKYLLEIINNN